MRFYNLDNEPGLWNSTHRDVHPLHPSYNELTNLGKQYAAAIKAVDPGALTLGPVQDGWTRYYIYRNYDGQGSQFGDTSVRAASADQGQLAIYAARRGSDGSLTLMIINKTGGALTSSVGLSGFSPASQARVYRYSAANLGAIVRQADQAVSAGGFTATFPANSITLVVLAPGTPPKKNYVPLVAR